MGSGIDSPSFWQLPQLVVWKIMDHLPRSTPQQFRENLPTVVGIYRDHEEISNWVMDLWLRAYPEQVQFSKQRLNAWEWLILAPCIRSIDITQCVRQSAYWQLFFWRAVNLRELTCHPGQIQMQWLMGPWPKIHFVDKSQRSFSTCRMEAGKF